MDSDLTSFVFMTPSDQPRTRSDLRILMSLFWLLVGWLVAGRVWCGEFNPAFYYGPPPFPQELRVFDSWVVEPAKMTDTAFVADNRDKLYAYVTLGEVSPSRSYFAQIPKAWLHGDNPAWRSRLVDQAMPDWPAFFVDQVITPLHERGYRNFFLDTLDSYHLVAGTVEERQRQEQGMIDSIRLLKSRYPDANLIVNRGFEVLPQIKDLVTAVVAESLFQSWNNETRQYLPVSGQDRQWLTRELVRVRDEYHLPVAVIDYAPPGSRALARKIASDIRELGFVPWVTSGDLTGVGLGAIEPMPRRVLMLYDGKVENSALRISTIHRYAAMPLNYLGYVPEYRDIAKDGLPETSLPGRYAGIVTWFHSTETTAGPAYAAWLLNQVVDGVPVAILGHFGFNISGETARRLELTHATARAGQGRHLRVLNRTASAAFEIEPLPLADSFFPLHAGGTADVWLRVGDGKDEQQSVAITAWGGYALAPYTVTSLPDSDQARWVIDPIAFFKRALKLPDMPVPDVSTENGRRLLLVHVDGDGFASKAEFPTADWTANVFYNEILRRYPVPTTVSVIEGETAADGRYPELSSQLEPIARAIFTLPHVEAASHSYSHPFRWRQAATHEAGEGYDLDIPGYAFDEEREIDGSVKYVTSLLPQGKRCGVFLWTGDCRPGGSALARTYRSGLLNMNGGETVISTTHPTLTAVGPLGIAEDGYFQVFAPNQNENRYTNLWTGPYYGFERVIETFRLTETPLRLKPINIYYHVFSASKAASLKSLKKVYDWALRQPVLPVFASDYIRKVPDFNDLVIAREGGGWRIQGGAAVRTLRMPRGLGYPDLARSKGILGWWDEGDVRYVHLSGAPASMLVLSNKPAARPRLARANGRITAVPGGWQVEAFRSIELELGQAEKCRVLVDGRPVSAQSTNGRLRLVKFPAHKAKVEMRCAH